MSGNFLSYSKGVKEPFQVQEGRCDFHRDATTAMGLISPGGENLLVCHEYSRFLLSYDGDLRDLIVFSQERSLSMGVVRDLSGMLSSQCRVLSPHLELTPDPKVSSPVLTWILGFLWSLHRGVRPHLKRRHAGQLFSRAVAAGSVFPSS